MNAAPQGPITRQSVTRPPDCQAAASSSASLHNRKEVGVAIHRNLGATDNSVTGTESRANHSLSPFIALPVFLEEDIVPCRRAFPLCGPSRIEDLTLRAPPGRIMRDGVHRRVDPYVDSLAACSNRESPRAISCTNTLRRRYSWPSKRVSRSHSMLFRERAADREGSNLPGVIAPPA